LLTYFPAAYPRWYLDGFGQIFATMAVKSDNVLEFGRAPSGAGAVLHEFGPYPIKDVLSDAYLTQKQHKTGWTPVHAWMLTHFLFFSDKRRPQLRQYLDITQQMNPVPELHLQPEATARYVLVDEVLAITKQAHVQKMGFVGNEYYMSIF